MKSTSLSIADKINPATLTVYNSVSAAATAIGVDWLVVGATARDMIYHTAFGKPIKRATLDIDLAIQVDNWDSFNALKNSLVENHGYLRSKSDHRLDLPDSKLWIDIIPFGAIAEEDGKYRWPNDPDKEISVLGFQDALKTAIKCQISNDPVFVLKVVHPAVLVLLKIISWQDRKLTKRTDAEDVAYALANYIELDNNAMRVYDDPTLYEGDLDMGTVGGRLVGRDLGLLAPGAALQSVRQFVQEEIDRGNESEFLADMMRGTTKLFADDSQYADLLANLATGIDEA